MGGATARGLAQSEKGYRLMVSDPCQTNLDALKEQYPAIEVTHDNKACIEGADLMILAVKPWLAAEVLGGIKEALAKEKPIVASFAAGISAQEIAQLTGADLPVFHVTPNTAIAVRQSMTFVSAWHTTPEQDNLLLSLFRELGDAMLIQEAQMGAGMALASCGIAYAFRYIRAAVEGGVELGLYPGVGQRIVQQTLRGAVALLEANESHPEQEIDKVTTPGGFTIRGLNAMEDKGFTSAVIAGLRASVK